MMIHYWKLGNGTWFMYDGKTFLKLHGGPEASVFCLETKEIFVFEPQSAKVAIINE